jgi:small-conductance mechanosensitive channel
MPFVLAQFGLGDQPWVEPVVAIAVVLVSMLVAAFVHLAVFPLIMHLAHRTPTELDGILIQAARWPLNVGVMVLGIYLSLTLTLDLPSGVQGFIDIVAQATGALLLVILFGRVVSRGMDWAIEEQGKRTRHTVDTRLLLMLRRVLAAMIYGLGLLLVINILGIPISPLIAGLGLGGVAVALAIQPTLSNLFAGTYVMTEGVVSPGDYIEMEGGIAGYVLEVGWRSTRLRTWSNNLVVVPNARFAETIITNYYEPDPPVNVYLTCGVSYDSDLARVEAVSMDVMNGVLDTSPHGVKEYGAYFGFDNFGESNVDFWLFVQARDRLASFELRSALIHELHRRFDEEGIVINYPVRSLQFPNGASPQPDGRPGVPPPAFIRRPPPDDIPSADIAAPDAAGPDGPDGPG